MRAGKVRLNVTLALELRQERFHDAEHERASLKRSGGPGAAPVNKHRLMHAADAKPALPSRQRINTTQLKQSHTSAVTTQRLL